VAGELDRLAPAILACVERIPPGRVMTYGDVAEYVGARSPRMVGTVLSHDGGTVPWHRVLKADGRPAAHLRDEQRQRLLAENVLFTGDRVDLARYRWDGGPAGARP
jgi:methylated-DNA-protein-cysteine methyltransferase related protein